MQRYDKFPNRPNFSETFLHKNTKKTEGMTSVKGKGEGSFYNICAGAHEGRGGRPGGEAPGTAAEGRKGGGHGGKGRGRRERARRRGEKALGNREKGTGLHDSGARPQ